MSIFDHLKKCIGESAETIIGKLDEINISLFAPLYTGLEELEFGEDQKTSYTREETAKIIMYLIYAYSAESEFIILGADVQDERYGIAKRVGLPENLYNDVISLRSPLVRKVMLAYLDKQVIRAFKYLSLKKNTYEAALNYCNESLMDSNGAVNMEKLADNDKYLGKLLLEVKAHEEEVRSEYNYYYENVDEVSTVSKRRNDNGNIEHSSEIQ